MNLTNLERKKALVKACLELGVFDQDRVDWTAVMDHLGWPEYDKSENYRSFWRHTVNQLKNRGYTVQDFVSWVVEEESPEYVEREESTPFEQYLASTGINLNDYEVKMGKTWGSSSNPNFVATFQPRQIPTKERFEKLVADLQTRNFEPVVVKPRSGKYLANVGIYDAHLEKVAIDGTGMETTAELYRKVVTDICTYLRNSQFPIDRIVFPIGNDFSNTDNALNTTTQGTPQQNSAPYRVAIDEMRKLAVWAIDQFSAIASVDVKIVPGNHDEYSSYYLGVILDAVYSNTDHVTVDNNHNPVKYYNWEKIGLMFVHGQHEKPKDMRGLFATEAPLIWANSEYREANSGHFHGQSELVHLLKEERGFYIIYNSALTPTDEWHSKKHFTDNLRGGSVRIYSHNRPVGAYYAML